jgi:lipoprotein signal peptidase
MLRPRRIFHVEHRGGVCVLQSFGGVSVSRWWWRSPSVLLPQVRYDWAPPAMGRGSAGDRHLIDRLTVWVTDFFSVGTFPVFNVADSCISIGVGVLLLSIWFKERDERAKAESQAAQGNGEAAETVPEETLSE